jgi:hypothetical protein
MVALLWVFSDSVLLSAFQQFLELLAPLLVRGFFALWNFPPVLQHSPAVVAPPALIRVAAILVLSPVPSLRRSPLCRSPSIHAASAIDTGATVYAASTVLATAALRDVLCVGEAPALEADAPSAMVAQVVG